MLAWGQHIIHIDICSVAQVVVGLGFASLEMQNVDNAMYLI